MTTMNQDRASKPRQALGRGLNALLQPGGSGRDFFVCPIEKIRPSPSQPRHVFGDEDIEELAQSIREQGVIQPLIVRATGEGYEIIVGERRWRAAQRAGLHEVPVVIRDVTPDKAFEMALVENLQRKDLNPIEEAEALGRLIESHGYTQEAAALKIGRSRAAVTNSLRLLKLPERVRKLVISGDLSEGHARALLSLKDDASISKLAEEAVSRGLSVRDLERLARAKAKPGAAKAAPSISPQIRSLVNRLERALGVKVRLFDKKGRGRLELHYSNLDVLDRILDKILR